MMQVSYASIRSALMLLIVTICGAVGLSPSHGQETIGKPQKYALLIGVNDYSPPLGKLEFCHNDMSQLRAHLEASGFPRENITFMHDAAQPSRLRPTRGNIEGELRLRLQLANESDLVVVAFSGHGLHLDGKSFLCPSDAKLDDGAGSMVSIDEMYRQLENCRAGQKLLIIDACRNEPVVRGFRAQLPDDLAVKIDAPPRGLLVLSSCEAGQFSAEDATLRQGVFMHYIVQGLEGAADTNQDLGGNVDGRVSLHELYYFAHEKTKRHVAESHGIIQRPVMRGEIVGRFDVAMVPDAARLSRLKQETVQATTTPTEIEAAAIRTPSGATAIDHPLLRQADAYLRLADHANAIVAYTAIIDDSSAPADVRREARKNRGVAYLARANKADLEKALIDQLAAGLPGVQLTIRASSTPLKVGQEVKGTLKQHQSILVTRSQGDWLWVASVDGSTTLQGYVMKDAVLQQPLAVATPQPVAQNPGNNVRSMTSEPRGRTNGYGNYSDYGDYGDHGNRSNYLDRLLRGSDDEPETSAQRNARTQLETQERRLDRLNSRGASESQIRNQEKAVERAERRFGKSRGDR